MLLACVSTAASLVMAAKMRARPIFSTDKQLGAPHVIHQAHANAVDDGFDLGGDRGGDVDLRLDEKKQAPSRKSSAPKGWLSGLDPRCRAGVDGGEDRGVADATERGHEHHLAQRAVHFAA